MKLLNVLLFVVFLPNVVFASSKEDTLYRGRDKLSKISFYSQDSVRISIECRKQNCEAQSKIKVTSKELSALKIRYGLEAQSPATQLCNYLKGEAIILFQDNFDQVSACQFKDKSIVLTWDLIYKISKQQI